MDLFSSASLVDAARDAGAILCFRALPIVAFALVTRRIALGPKVATAVAYGAASLALRAWTAPKLGGLLAAYAYFTVVACTLPWVTRALRDARLTRSALFAGSGILFLAVPSLFVPGPARAISLIIGWDLVLSSYSYGVEVARADGDPPIGACLFFLLVNPALVYVNRGSSVRAPAIHGGGAARAVLGVVTLVGAAAFLHPVCSFLEVRASGDAPLRSTLPALAGFGALRFLLEYGRQSGLASLQIGMMRQIGYDLPERYRFPLLATDPMDFWRRWNTYVNGWLFRYVFWPVANRYRRHGLTWRLPAAQAVAFLVTFVVIGALHDAYAYAVAFDSDGGWLRAFSAVGVVVVIWMAVARGAKRLLARSPRPGALARFHVVSRLCFWAVAVGCVAWGWR